ncbi:MAG TPA: hypothetical protein VK327_04435 [Candidatus Paceibacterota bacterium]|nr:hypothetical protein [Candidatus Paceibacterota bacterium]
MLAFGGFSAFAQQTNHANPRDFSAFQIITDRNIFDPNRRPRVQQSRTPPRVQQIVDSFSLVGTMSYSNVVLAFFDGTGSEYRKSLAVSNRIAGYTVLEIRQDAVKLALDTNEVELKVGMQMRRSEDGKWSAAEGSNTGSSSSYAGNRQRGNDRGERRSYRNNSNENAGEQQPEPAAPMPDTATAGGPPDIANLDTNDPVARLMLRRMREENGGQLPSAPGRTEAPSTTTDAPSENDSPAPMPPPDANPNVEPPQ